MKALATHTALTAVFMALAISATPASANLGDPLYVQNSGDVWVYFAGSDAGYDSHLSVNGSADFFPNHATAVGTALNLGYFAAGTLLDVVLHVDTTDLFFHSGPGADNPDKLPHANVLWNYDFLGPNGAPRAWVGFEDISGGGDRDYNDHMFLFSNTTPVPEAQTYAMLLAGLGMLGMIIRRRA